MSIRNMSIKILIVIIIVIPQRDRFKVKKEGIGMKLVRRKGMSVIRDQNPIISQQ